MCIVEGWAETASRLQALLRAARLAWMRRWSLQQFAIGVLPGMLVCVLGLSGCGSHLVTTGNNAVVFEVTPSPATFGTVTVGQTASMNITLKNETLYSVTISQMTISGKGFSIAGGNSLPVTVDSGGTYSFSAKFTPAELGAATGQLTVTSNASSDASTVVELSGTGAAAIPPVSSLTCASTALTGAASDECTVTLSAAAPTGDLTVSLASDNTAVTVPSSVTVSAGSTTAAFAATVKAVSTAQTATLTAKAGGGSSTFTLQLGGAMALLGVNATKIAFGNVLVNSSATQTVTLTSAGTSAVTVTAASLTGVGFTLSGSSFPATLNPGQTATMDVTFSPEATGTSTGTLTITSTAAAALTNISLSGTGGNAMMVVLNWDAPSNTSSDTIAGYNIYRAMGSNSAYSRINSGAIGAVTYTDTALKAGTTYMYYVTSVDAAGNESVPSNTATAAIP